MLLTNLGARSRHVSLTPVCQEPLRARYRCILGTVGAFVSARSAKQTCLCAAVHNPVRDRSDCICGHGARILRPLAIKRVSHSTPSTRRSLTDTPFCLYLAGYVLSSSGCLKLARCSSLQHLSTVVARESLKSPAMIRFVRRLLLFCCGLAFHANLLGMCYLDC